MKFLKNPAVLTVLAATAAAILIVLFYKNPQQNLYADDRIALAIIVPSFILGAGAVWLFLSSLRDFKSGLKAPYFLLSVGILLLPLYNLLAAMANFVVKTGPLLTILGLLSTLCLLLALPIIYLSMRRFAKLVNYVSRLRSIRFVLLVGLATSLFVGAVWILLSLRNSTTSDSLAQIITVAIVVAAIVINIVFGIVATLLSSRIKHILGAFYTSAMNQLTVAIAAATFTLIYTIVLSFLLSFVAEEPAWYSAIDIWPLALTGLLFLLAGQSFWDKGRNPVKLHNGATYVDAVVFVAQLVSDSRAIDKTLDQLRVVTAAMAPNAELSATNKKKLLETYLEIETYLTGKDPLRKFTKQELRSRLTYDFQQSLMAYDQRVGVAV